jgi:hypothetical protein
VTPESKVPAAIFLGNAIVARRDDASWVRYGDAFPTAGQYEPVELLELLISADDATADICLNKIEEWTLRKRPPFDSL